MEVFRKFVTGWFGKGLLVLFTIPFALLGIEGYFAQSGSPNAAHVVNGDSISKEDLDAQIQSLQQTYLQVVNGDASLLDQNFIRKAALNNLISRQLLLQQAEKLGISLSVAQIEQMLAQSAQLQENGVFSPKKYEEYLRATKQTNESFVAQVRQDQAVQMLVTGLNASLVNQKDIQQLISLASEQRHLYLASIPLAEYRQTLQATDEEIKTYYEKHKQQFTQLAQAEVDYIIVKPEQLHTQANPVTEDELKQAYQQYVQNLPRTVKHILITTTGRSEAEAKQRADEAYAKLKAGTPFAEVAKTYSEDVDSKDKGGVISHYEKGSVSESFDQAIQASHGEATQPIKTNFGYHIIASEAPSTVASFDSLKAQLTQQVQKKNAETASVEAINKLNEDVIGSDSLETVQQAIKGTTIEHAKLIANTKHPILSQAMVKNRIFSEEAKNGEHRVSSSLQLVTGEVVWLKVKSYTPAGIQPLDVVKDRVKQQVLNEKAATSAKAKLEKTLADFKTRSAQEVVTESSLKFEDAGLVSRGQNLLPQVQNVAFSLPDPKDGQWSVGTLAMGNELLVIAVSEVKSINTETKEQLQQYTPLYRQYYAQRDLADYIEYLKSTANIKDIQSQ